MSYEQRQQFRETYNQLRLAIAFPGETVAGEYRKPYTAVCKDDWTFDYAMTQPDTPDTPTVARLRNRERGMWAALGTFRQVA